MVELTGNRAGIGVAIMGYGTVGKGVAHVIRYNTGQIEKRTGIKLRIAHILDLLDFPESPDAALITHDVSTIMNDENVRVVVETMGGVNTAFEYTKKALALGKHVVTSNKELIAERGPELLALAESHGVYYRFDASVGGGVPAIVPIHEYLAANNIVEICGILNGTTNFMLTHMRTHGAQFIDTLRLAQEKGFAEKNPEADIEGSDACRKLAILSSVAWDAFLDWKAIHTEGVAKITIDDIVRASELGCTLKLTACARRLEDGRVEAYVLPVMLDKRDPLANVEGVNNAILLRGDLTGDIILYGQGAGMLPTGSAIVSDILKITNETRLYQVDPQSQKANSDAYPRETNINPRWDRASALGVVDFSTYKHAYYARISTPYPDIYRDTLFREFPKARILPDLDADTITSAPCPHGAGAAGAKRTGDARKVDIAQASDGEDAVDIATSPDGADTPMCSFIVPPLTEGEFAGRLSSVNERVAGSVTQFVARIFKSL